MSALHRVGEGQNAYKMKFPTLVTKVVVLPRGKLALAYLGMYRILSATTNPTLKNRLEAGRKGIHNKARDNTRTSCSLGYKTKMERRDFLCYSRHTLRKFAVFKLICNKMSKNV